MYFSTGEEEIGKVKLIKGKKIAEVCCPLLRR
jgi:hypothetical protein